MIEYMQEIVNALNAYVDNPTPLQTVVSMSIIFIVAFSFVVYDAYENGKSVSLGSVLFSIMIPVFFQFVVVFLIFLAGAAIVFTIFAIPAYCLKRTANFVIDKIHERNRSKENY
jgi:hypothetical protein